ncbi:MAG: DUF1906 domain-containing protein [Firmicutes bacterium]|nr:DUF1906 domain-containing protein [Bacillota bacterium]
MRSKAHKWTKKKRPKRARFGIPLALSLAFSGAASGSMGHMPIAHAAQQLTPSSVYFYASNAVDLQNAYLAAASVGVSNAHVTGNFSTAWKWVDSANTVVIAVGAPAVNALYYNPAGWANPSKRRAGSTPFELFARGKAVTAAQNRYFADAAGGNRSLSLELAQLLADAAIDGQLDKPLPKQSEPTRVVSGTAVVSGVNALPHLSVNQVYLYAATPVDLANAQQAARKEGLPAANVTGNFWTAWNLAKRSDALVIAVGASAVNALFYNPSGWPNPDKIVKGHTPFDLWPEGQVVSQSHEYLFANAAGKDRYASAQLAEALTWGALHGALPFGVPFPAQSVPTTQNSGQPNLTDAVVIAPVNGADMSMGLTPTAIAQLQAQGYTFAARYLGGGCFPKSGDVLTADEANAVHAAGLQLVSIYSGANNVPGAAVCGGSQTYAAGVAAADDAAQLAAVVGQPQGTGIFLDIEANQSGSGWLAYFHGWQDELAKRGYIPGIYSSPAQLSQLHAQSWVRADVLYWVAHWVSRSKQDPPPDPTAELSFAQMWQYAGGNVTPIGGVPVDLDSAKGAQILW